MHGTRVTKGDEQEHDRRPYGRKCKQGEVIEMKLDLNKQQLSYSINGDDQGIAFEQIEKCEYIACLSTHQKNNCIQLLSYKSIQ